MTTERSVGGRYRLQGKLGSGGMGTVWCARDEVLGRQVAVKEVVFPPGTHPEDVEVLVERTRREARFAARLDHPNAVTVYDVVEEDGRPWLVMQLVDAPTLAQVVADEGPLSPREAARVGLAVLGALTEAHRQGIVHRDVKPSNVLIADSEAGRRVVLTDFGIATSSGDSSLTRSGLLIGSPAYIAPERARGEPAGPASDLWSLGATLFSAVEGRPPFDAGEPLLTVSAVLTAEHAPYAAAGPLAPVLDGLLDKDTVRRLDAASARLLLKAIADGPDLTVRGPSAAVMVPAGRAPTARELAGTTAVLHLPDPPTTAVVPAPNVPGGQAPPAGVPRADASRPVAAPETMPPAHPPVGLGRSRFRRASAVAGATAAVVVVGGLILATGKGAGTLGTGRASSGPATGRTTAVPTAAVPTTVGSPARAVAPTSAPSRTAGPTTPAGPATTPSSRTTPAAQAARTPPAGGELPVPPGWRTYRGGPGWTVVVPPTWVPGTSGGFPQYRDPATGRTLRVSTGTAVPDAVGDRQRQARAFAAQHPTYSQLRIARADYRGYPSADWEFTYEGLHVLDRVFVASGLGHSLYFQTGAGDFAAAAPQVQQILAGFVPEAG